MRASAWLLISRRNLGELCCTVFSLGLDLVRADWTDALDNAAALHGMSGHTATSPPPMMETFMESWFYFVQSSTFNPATGVKSRRLFVMTIALWFKAIDAMLRSPDPIRG